MQSDFDGFSGHNMNSGPMPLEPLDFVPTDKAEQARLLTEFPSLRNAWTWVVIGLCAAFVIFMSKVAR